MEHIEDEENKKPYKVSLLFRDSFKFPSHISFNIPPRKKIIFFSIYFVLLFLSVVIIQLCAETAKIKKSKTI